MQRLMSALLTASLLASTTTPALAGHGDKGGGQSSAPKAAASQATAPKDAGRAARDNANVAAPVRVERAIPAQRAERAVPAQRAERAIPAQRAERAIPAQRAERSIPQARARVERAIPAQRAERSIPQASARVERAAPVRAERERVERQFAVPNVPENVTRVRSEVRETRVRENIAPFAQVIGPRVREREQIEARHFDRDDNIVVQKIDVPAWHPAFVTGRLVEDNDDQLLLTTPAGQQVVVFVRGHHGKHWGWRNRLMTIPVVMQNGVYYAVVPQDEDFDHVATTFVAPSGFVYPGTFVQSYAYAPAYYTPTYAYAPAYVYPTANSVGNYAMASTLTNLLSNVLGSSNRNSLTNSLLTNFLASYLVGSIAGNTPYYAQPYSPVTQVLGASYAPNYVAPTAVYPATYAVTPSYSTPLSYAYPMTCVTTDPNTGATFYDPSCAPAATTTFVTAPTAFAPSQVQGVVVGTSGSTLMVLGANGTQPVLIDASPALQMGHAINGAPTVGRVVDAFGYYNGNTFVATTLV